MAETPERGRSGPLARPVLTFVTLLALAVLIGLGVWQLRRLAWKEDLLAQIAAARQASAVPLEDALAAVDRGEPAGFRRVVGACPALEQAGILELHAIIDGQVGRRWISACPLGEGPYAAILVDRGFVPEGAVPPPPKEGRGLRPVVGFLRAPEPPGRFAGPVSSDGVGGAVWYRRDIDAMSRGFNFPGPVAPVFLMLESPPPASGLPRPAPLPTQIPNNHLGYALTWFGLAAALLGVYLAMVFKPRKPT